MDEEVTKVQGSRKWRIRGAGLVMSGLIAGGLLAGSLTAGAQTADTSQPAATAGDPMTSDKPVRSDETALTGDTAAKVTAAAQAAVPDGTIIRVETDSDGSPYEAHMRAADGSPITVKVGADFKVTATETGGMGGPRG